MAGGPTSDLLQPFYRAALGRDGAGLSDGELLEGFVTRRDGAFFEALVRRHGPMVLGVCRRILRDPHAAEDAFQAAFLVLAQRAVSVVPRKLVGNWLYGVAYRTALEARRAAARRRARERQVNDMPHPQAEDGETWQELLPLLDRELDRLPAKYRAPVVLCHLEGRTRKEAADQLGLPVGTLSGRLTTAMRLLARRMRRHGLALSATALAASLSPASASAAVPASLLASTVKATPLLAGGQAAAGVVSVEVAALVNGVQKALLLVKLRLASAVVLAVAALAGGAGAFAYHATGADQQAPEGGPSPRPPDGRGAGGAAERPAERPRGPAPGPDRKADAGPSDKERLQGAWVPAAAVIQGRKTDPGDKKVRRASLTIDAGEASFMDARGPYTLDPRQRPRHLDLLLQVKGHQELVKAIYDFDGDRLMVSWISGGERPPDFDTGKSN
jgi:RNA polymerase sigma-70 factor (ECF subfamily)